MTRLSLLLASVFTALAVTVEWDPNPETNVAGYRVYWGTRSRLYDTVIDVGNQTFVQLPTPTVKTYYAVTAYDTDGLESDFSEEVFYEPPIEKPSSIFLFGF